MGFSRRGETMLAVVVDSTLADSDVISFEDFSGGTIRVPTGETAVTFTYHASVNQDLPNQTAVYDPLQDQNGTAVTQTVAADKIYALPDALFGCRHIKITGNVDATADIFLKS